MLLLSLVLAALLGCATPSLGEPLQLAVQQGTRAVFEGTQAAQVRLAGLGPLADDPHLNAHEYQVSSRFLVSLDFVDSRAGCNQHVALMRVEIKHTSQTGGAPRSFGVKELLDGSVPEEYYVVFNSSGVLDHILTHSNEEVDRAPLTNLFDRIAHAFGFDWSAHGTRDDHDIHGAHSAVYTVGETPLARVRTRSLDNHPGMSTRHGGHRQQAEWNHVTEAHWSQTHGLPESFHVRESGSVPLAPDTRTAPVDVPLHQSAGESARALRSAELTLQLMHVEPTGATAMLQEYHQREQRPVPLCSSETRQPADLLASRPVHPSTPDGADASEQQLAQLVHALAMAESAELEMDSKTLSAHVDFVRAHPNAVTLLFNRFLSTASAPSSVTDKTRRLVLSILGLAAGPTAESMLLRCLQGECGTLVNPSSGAATALEWDVVHALGQLRHASSSTLHALYAHTIDAPAKHYLWPLVGALVRHMHPSPSTAASLDALAAATRACSNHHVECVVAGLNALGNAGGAHHSPDALSTIHDHLEHPSEPVVVAATQALRHVPTLDAETQLLDRLCDHPSPAVRLSALSALHDRVLSTDAVRRLSHTEQQLVDRVSRSEPNDALAHDARVTQDLAALLDHNRVTRATAVVRQARRAVKHVRNRRYITNAPTVALLTGGYANSWSDVFGVEEAGTSISMASDNSGSITMAGASETTTRSELKAHSTVNGVFLQARFPMAEVLAAVTSTLDEHSVPANALNAGQDPRLDCSQLSTVNSAAFAALPACPCSIAKDSNGIFINPDRSLWVNSYESSLMLAFYKPGAQLCLTSRLQTPTGPRVAEQQCCYATPLGASAFELITLGDGAGSVLSVSPWYNYAREHFVADMAPLISCRNQNQRATYTTRRPTLSGTCTAQDSGVTSPASSEPIRLANVAGEQLIMSYTGYSAQLKPSITALTSVIGYGHVPLSNEVLPVSLSMDQAELLLLFDMIAAQNCVQALDGTAAFTDDMFSAMVSFALSLGCTAFTASPLASSVNNVAAVPSNFLQYTQSDLPSGVTFLVNRRQAEGELFLRGVPLVLTPTYQSSATLFKIAGNVLSSVTPFTTLGQSPTLASYSYATSHPRTAVRFFGPSPVSISFSTAVFSWTSTGNGFYSGSINMQIQPSLAKFSASAVSSVDLTVAASSQISQDGEEGKLALSADIAKQSPSSSVSQTLKEFPYTFEHNDFVDSTPVSTTLTLEYRWQDPVCGSCGKGCQSCKWEWTSWTTIPVWNLNLPSQHQVVVQDQVTLTESPGPYGATVFDGSAERELDFSQNTRFALCSWNAFAVTNTRIALYEVGLVTSASATPTTWMPVGTARFAAIYPSGGIQSAQLCAVRGTTFGGQKLVQYSNGFDIDTTPPLVGVVFDGELNADLTYTSVQYSAMGSWTMNDPTSGPIATEITVALAPFTTELLVPWVFVGAVKTYTQWFTLQTALPQDTTVYYGVRGINEAGLMSVQWSNGVTIDLTPPVLPSPGVLISSARRALLPAVNDESSDILRFFQSDASRVNVTFPALNDPDSGISTVDVACGPSPGDITTAVASATGLTYVSSSPWHEFTELSLVHESSYFCWIVAYNGAEDHAVYIGPAFVVDTEAPVVLRVLDGNAATDEVFQETPSEACVSWLAQDNTSSIVRVEWAVGTAVNTDDVLSWGPASNQVSAGRDCRTVSPPMTDETMLFTSVRVTDAAGSVSAPMSSNGFIVDDTPPVAGAVLDGCTVSGSDIEFQADPTRACVTLTGFSDVDSGILGYKVAYGTSPGSESLAPFTWVDGLALSITEGLNLTAGVPVYGTVRVYNGAGLFTQASSNGFVTAPYPPALGTVFDGQNATVDQAFTSNPTHICGTWSGFSEPISGVTYSVALGSQRWLTDLAPLRSVGTDTDYCFTNVSVALGVTAHVIVTATSGANLKTSTSSNGIVVDTTEPVAGLINDGPGSDVEYIKDLAQASWSATPAPTLYGYSDQVGPPEPKSTAQFAYLAEDLIVFQPADVRVPVAGNDCDDVLRRSGGTATTGLYIVQGEMSSAVQLMCEMTTAGGGVELIAAYTDADGAHWNYTSDWGFGPAFGNVGDLDLTTGGHDFRSVAYHLRKYADFAVSDSTNLQQTVVTLFGCLQNSTVEKTMQSMLTNQTFLDLSKANNAGPPTSYRSCFVSATHVPSYFKSSLDGSSLISTDGQILLGASCKTNDIVPIAGAVAPPSSTADKYPAGLGFIADTPPTTFKTPDVGDNDLCASGATYAATASQCALAYPQTVYLFGVKGRLDSQSGPAWRVGGGKGTLLGFIDHESTVVSYEACLGTAPYKCDAAPRRSTGATAAVTFSNAVMTEGTRYFTTVWAHNGAGLVNSSYTNGFVYDTSAPEPGRIVDGTNIDVDVDYVGVNNQLAACFDAFATPSGVAFYQIGWGTFPGQDDIFGFETLSAPLPSVICITRVPSPVLTPLRDYYFTVRAVTLHGLVTEGRSDGFLVDTSPPLAYYVYDGDSATDEAYLTPETAPLWGRWLMLEDSPSTINYDVAIETLTGESVVPYADMGPLTSASFAGASLADGLSYRFAVRGTNQAGLSTVAYSNGFLVDMSPPTAGVVVITGPSVESRVPGYVAPVNGAVKYLSVLNEACFTIAGFAEPHASLTGYEVRYVLSEPNAESSPSWVTSTTLLPNATDSCISLSGTAEGLTLAISIRAVSITGTATEAVSQVVRFSVVPPQGSVARDGLTLEDLEYVPCSPVGEPTTRMCANWDAFSTPGTGGGRVVAYQLAYAGLASVFNVTEGCGAPLPSVYNTPATTVVQTITGFIASGLSANVSTNGVRCDASPPTVGVVDTQCAIVVSGEDALRQQTWRQSGFTVPTPTIAYVASAADVCFHWSNFTENDIPGGVTYQFGLGLNAMAPANVLPFENTGTVTSVVATGLANVFAGSSVPIYGLVRATNIANMSSIGASQAVWVDSAKPTVTSMTVTNSVGSQTQTVTDLLCANVTGLTANGPSGLARVVYAAVDSTGSRVSSYVAVDPALWSNPFFEICLSPTVGALQTLVNNARYTVQLYATSGASVTNVYQSGAILIDTLAPSAGNVALIVDGVLDQPFLADSDNSGACASWSGVNDVGSGLASVHVQLVKSTASAQGAVEVDVNVGVAASEGTHCFSPTVNDEQYFFRVIATDVAGLRATSESATFLVDKTFPVGSVSAASYVAAGAQVTYAGSDPETAVVSTRLGFGSSSTGTANLVPFAPMFLSAATLSYAFAVPSGTEGYLILELTNGAGMVSLSYSSLVTVDASGPTPSQVFNRVCATNSVQDRFIQVDDSITACWLPFSDPQTPFHYVLSIVEARDGTTPANTMPSSPVFAVPYTYAAAENVTMVTLDPLPGSVKLTNGKRYVTCISGVNQAGIYGEASCTLSYLVDTTPPVAGQVHGGVNETIYEQSTDKLFTIFWGNFSDPESGPTANNGSFAWLVGYTNRSDILSEPSLTTSGLLKNVGYLPTLGRYEWVGLSLNHGQQYYGVVCAVNAAGGTTCVRSNPVMVNTTLPASFFYATEPPRFNATNGYNGYPYTSDNETFVYELTSCVDEVSGCAYCLVCVSSDRDGNCGVLPQTNLGLLQTLILQNSTLDQNTFYYYNVTCCNHGGLCDSKLTTGVLVDVTPPETVSRPHLRLPTPSHVPFPNAPVCEQCGRAIEVQTNTSASEWTLFSGWATELVVVVEPRDNETGVLNTTVVVTSLSKGIVYGTLDGLRQGPEPAVFPTPADNSDFAGTLSPISVPNLNMTQGERLTVQYTATNGAFSPSTSALTHVVIDLTPPPAPRVWVSLAGINAADKVLTSYLPHSDNITFHYTVPEDPDATPIVQVYASVQAYNRNTGLMVPFSEYPAGDVWSLCGMDGTCAIKWTEDTVPDDGNAYRVAVRTVNAAGVPSAVSLSELTVVDTSAPHPGSIHEGSGTVDVSASFGELWCTGAVEFDAHSHIVTVVYLLNASSLAAPVFETVVEPTASTGAVSVRVPSELLSDDTQYTCAMMATNAAGLFTVVQGNGVQYHPPSVEVTLPTSGSSVWSFSLGLPDSAVGWSSLSLSMMSSSVQAGPTTLDVNFPTLGVNGPVLGNGARRRSALVSHGWPTQLWYVAPDNSPGLLRAIWFMGQNEWGNDSALYTDFAPPMTIQLQSDANNIVSTGASDNLTHVDVLRWNETVGVWQSSYCGLPVNETLLQWGARYHSFTTCRSGYFALWLRTEENSSLPASVIAGAGVGAVVLLLLLVLLLVFVVRYRRVFHRKKRIRRRQQASMSAASLWSNTSSVIMGESVHMGATALNVFGGDTIGESNDHETLDVLEIATMMAMSDLDGSASLDDRDHDSMSQTSSATGQLSGAQLFVNEAYEGFEGYDTVYDKGSVSHSHDDDDFAIEGGEAHMAEEDGGAIVAAMFKVQLTEAQRWDAIGEVLTRVSDELVQRDQELEEQMHAYGHKRELASMKVQKSAFGVLKRMSQHQSAGSSSMGAHSHAAQEEAVIKVSTEKEVKSAIDVAQQLSVVGQQCQMLCPDARLRAIIVAHVEHLQNTVMAFSIVKRRATVTERLVFARKMRQLQAQLVEACVAASIAYETDVAEVNAETWRKTVRIKAGAKKRSALRESVLVDPALSAVVAGARNTAPDGAAEYETLGDATGEEYGGRHDGLLDTIDTGSEAQQQQQEKTDAWPGSDSASMFGALSGLEAPVRQQQQQRIYESAGMDDAPAASALTASTEVDDILGGLDNFLDLGE